MHRPTGIAINAVAALLLLGATFDRAAAQNTPPPQQPAGKGMLDEIPERQNEITIFPPGRPAAPATTQPPAAGQPATATTTAPAATPPPPASASLTDVVRSALGQGIYITPPTAGTPLATAVDEIAKQCQKPATEVQAAMRTLSRPPATMTKLPIVSVDKKETGGIYLITVPPSSAALPPALACLALPAPAPVFRLDLVVNAREFGPIETKAVDAGALAQLATSINGAFGDAAGQAWRLATADELLAILPVMNNESLWGPDGGHFWTASTLQSGQRILVEAKPDKRDYLADVKSVDAATKAIPVWVRTRN